MSQNMAEGRADNSPVKPREILHGLNQTFCIKIADTQESIERAREELIKMLTELSDFALRYVWRPIVYAYCLTDGCDPDCLTNDDAERFSLIGVAAYESPEFVNRLSSWRSAMERAEWKRRQEGMK